MQHSKIYERYALIQFQTSLEDLATHALKTVRIIIK